MGFHTWGSRWCLGECLGHPCQCSSWWGSGNAILTLSLSLWSFWYIGTLFVIVQINLWSAVASVQVCFDFSWGEKVLKPILWQGFQLAASFVFDFGHLQRDGTGWKSHPSLRDSSSQRGCEIVYAFSKSSISHPFWDIPSGMDFNLRMKWWFYFPSRFFKYIRHPLGWANGMENRRCPN